MDEILDAIVCDPPYGVRAGGKKSVAKEREIRDRDNYIPSTDPYTLAGERCQRSRPASMLGRARNCWCQCCCTE